MKKMMIEKSVNIKATPEQVWKVLTQDDLTRQWYAVFSAGTYARTDNWKQGSRVDFVDATNCGMIGTVAVHDPSTKLVIQYEGQIVNGVEDFTSDIAQQIKEGRESYTLLQQDGHTQLLIAQDMTEEYFEMMSAQWDQALAKIKSLSEQ